MKNKSLIKKLLVLLVVLITCIPQVWGYTATFRCVPALAFGSNWSEGNICKVKYDQYHDGSGADLDWATHTLSWTGLMYESGGNLYKIYEYKCTTMPQDGAKWVKFMRYEGDTWKEEKNYNDWQNASWWSGCLCSSSWTSFAYKTWNIASGTTIVWDAGNQSWGNTSQIYIYKKSDANNNNDYVDTQSITQLGSTQQFYKTFSSAWSGYGGFLFRGANDFSHGQTTNINTDVSSSTNIVLFAHSNDGSGNGTYTDGKADWQKVSPAYKANSGATVYFDNTVTNWSKVYLKTGTQWFNRSVEITSNVVPGTGGKLLYYTFPHDVYYGQFMFADGYGWTNYYPIDDSHCSHYTALQASHISSAKTLIPTANAQKGATTVLSGYERTVTISSYSHGTVTVSYTDAGNTARSKTSGNFDVQQACVITVTAVADEGYTLTGLTIGGNSASSGDTYAVRANTTVAATITANTYYVRFNSNYPEGASGSGSMSNETFTYDASAKALTANAFSCVGYDFAGWNTEPDGSGDPYDNQESVQNLTITADDIVDLYAQWTPSEYTITLNDRGATGAVSPSSVTATYNSSAIDAITNPTKWGNVFGGWVANSNGTGDVIINTDGELVASITGYTDGSGNWINTNDDLTLYAKWTPKAASSIYLVDHVDNPTAVTSGTTFNETGTTGVYYVTVDMDKNDAYHFGDGIEAAGPEGASADRIFPTPLDITSLAVNEYGCKYTGTNKQTVVFRIDLNSVIDNKVRLYVDHIVIYKSGDKAGDTHTAYGSVAGFSGTIYGEFEFRMSVQEDTWETLYLPFTPSAVKVWEDGIAYSVVPYIRPEGKGTTLYYGDYIIRTPSETENLDVKDFGEWNDPETWDYSTWHPSGNTPYIIMWHDWTGYSYFDDKYVSFYGNAGVTIPASMGSAGAAPEKNGVVNIYGNSALISGLAKSAYVLTHDGDEVEWRRPEDPKDNSTVEPFGCYVLASAETTLKNPILRRWTGENTATGWDDVLNSEPQAQVSVYTITGFKVAQFDNCSLTEAGRRVSAVYDEGIFILHTNNESVKLILCGK